MSLVARGGGQARLATANGEQLTLRNRAATASIVTDRKGDQAVVTIPNVLQSNGVIHVVDAVLLPS